MPLVAPFDAQALHLHTAQQHPIYGGHQTGRWVARVSVSLAGMGPGLPMTPWTRVFCPSVGHAIMGTSWVHLGPGLHGAIWDHPEWAWSHACMVVHGSMRTCLLLVWLHECMGTPVPDTRCSIKISRAGTIMQERSVILLVAVYDITKSTMVQAEAPSSTANPLSTQPSMEVATPPRDC